MQNITFERQERTGQVIALTPRQRLALALVARYSGRYGRTRLAEMLAGEPTARVRGAGLDLELEYGAFARLGLRGAYGMLRSLEQAELIAIDPSRGRYLVLEVTALGRDALGMPPPPRTRQGSKMFESPRDQALFDTLVMWRNEIAARSGWMGSEIARLRDLRKLVHERPRSLEEIAGKQLIVPGAEELFGPVALEVLHEGRGPP